MKLIKRLFRKRTKVLVRTTYGAGSTLEKVLGDLEKTIKHHPDIDFKVVLQWKDY